MTLKKRIFKNSIATGFQKLATILNQLLLVPFFLQNWGADLYGEWLTLTIIPSMLAFADFGFGSAAANSMVLAYANDKKQSFANMAKTGLRTISGLVVVVLIISVVTVLFLAYLNIFEKSLINSKQAVFAVLMLMTARSMGFFQQLFEAYFRAAQKAHIGIYLNSFYLLFMVGFSILVLNSGGGVVHLAMVNIILSLIYYPAFALVAKKTLRLKSTIKGKFSKALMKSFVRTGVGYLLAPMWQAILLQGTTFVVRLSLGPAAVALYNTVRTVANTVIQGVSMLVVSTFPDLQFEIGAGRYENARKIFRISFLIAALFGIGSSVFLLVFGEWIYKVWTAKTLDPPTLMWVIFMISVFFKAIWWVTGGVFRAFNKPYSINLPALFLAILSVIISWIMIKLIGISGAAIGAFLMDLLLFIYVVPKAFNILNENIYAFVSNIITDAKHLMANKLK